MSLQVCERSGTRNGGVHRRRFVRGSRGKESGTVQGSE